VAESQQTLETLLAAESHAAGIAEFESAAHALGLLNVDKLGDLAHAARRAEPVLPLVQSLQRRLGTVEGLLRIAALLERLDANTSRLVRRLLDEGATPETAWTVVKAAALQAEVQRRLRDQPVLLRTDGARVESSHSRYRELNLRRRELVRDVVRQRWISNQRERLLASTGSRLNSLGAEIRRRLVTRGERAMRVRQMIQAGNAIEGGDPLFVLRPVWMASPDVVAQIFPRQALFDVVIFDEASQCRLEEALPVLLRARRVVIAGDPQQLPPTRFFESGVAQSQQQQSEDEQSLFEAQQSEVEDLLGAALNLSVEQAYLDVHYRSRNADLIAFSNANFYDSRLQPIPAHPSSRAKLPPLRLIPAKGVYDKRSNPTEALEVVKIVKRLLSEAHPPSIGIACFNITQRDEIVEALDLAAAQDHHFAAQLAVARMRKGEASSEALFVRNLENVQGDERDHMIISTTFGPDPHGRFYRRFGPLGQAGGGRRLNVLVTRAREMVHLVTSIPPGVYNSRPEIPSGASPSGGWLLFSYLAYAEWLERAYAEEQQHHGQSESASSECHVLDTKYPSEFARALGELLASEHAIGSQVHWGNDGFAVDAALQHPEREDDVTIGVLCDGSRFAKAADRVQWDIFRTEVLEGQRWRLQRIWSPQLFRDPEGTIAQLIRKREEWLREEADAKRTAELAKRADMQMLN
jgi:Fe2+ transport system protein FeoA